MRKLIAFACVTALVVAGIGTASASGLLTGKDIKNHSITGRDIRRGTLSLSLLKPSTQRLIRLAARTGLAGGKVAASQGTQGAGGPQGPQGATGTQGPGGPSGTTLIRPGSLQGFSAVHSTGCLNPGETSTGSQGFDGAYELRVGSQGNSYEKINKPYDAPLSDLTELKYDTLAQHSANGSQAPYIVINVDPDGDNSTDNDESVFFEPVYQDGSYGFNPSSDKAPAQEKLKPHDWQRWNARDGGLEVNGSGPPLFTLDYYESQHPNARMKSIAVAAGCGSVAWDNFVGNVRHLSIGIGPNVADYVFQG